MPGIIILAKAISNKIAEFDNKLSRSDMATSKRAEDLKSSVQGVIIKYHVELIESISKLANNLDNGSSSSYSFVFIRNSDVSGMFTLDAHLSDYDGILHRAIDYKNGIYNIHIDDSIHDFRKQLEDYKKRIEHQEKLYRYTAFSGMTESEYNWVKDSKFVVDDEFSFSDGYRFDENFAIPCKPADKNIIVELLANAIHERLPNADVEWGENISIVIFKGTGKFQRKR